METLSSSIFFICPTVDLHYHCAEIAINANHDIIMQNTLATSSFWLNWQAYW